LPPQLPQSPGQVLQSSPLLHTPSPQYGHAPQSCGQLEQLSPPLQAPSPQHVVAWQTRVLLTHASVLPQAP
jgi:hypothetical protein